MEVFLRPVGLLCRERFRPMSNRRIPVRLIGEPTTNDMKYLMKILHADPAAFEALGKDGRNRVHQECGAWHEELELKGQTLFAAALQPPETATTFRENAGRIVVTDGPFAETKEVLGGFEILECENLDEAIAVAKRFPGLKAGGMVELWPIRPGNDCTED